MYSKFILLIAGGGLMIVSCHKSNDQANSSAQLPPQSSHPVHTAQKYDHRPRIIIKTQGIQGNPLQGTQIIVHDANYTFTVTGVSDATGVDTIPIPNFGTTYFIDEYLQGYIPNFTSVETTDSATFKTDTLYQN